MKIGILFPLSNVHPGMGMDFMDGLNSFLKYKQHTGSVSFLKEGIGFGAMEKDVFIKAQKLLISDDVDLLIAYVDEKILPVLYPLAQATGKLMLVVNPGANYPVNWIAQPTVIQLNLQHAFLCWLSGALAARSGNGHAALATTYYDCGYMHAAAMVKNLLDAGGDIKFNYINNQAYNDSFEISQLTNFLSANSSCENLVCVFDEQPAALFYRHLDDYTAAGRLHLFVSPMMLQEKAIKAHDSGFAYSVEGFIPWHAGMENEMNEVFVRTISRPATIFSLLGWETAIIIDELLQTFKDDSSNGDALVAHLKNRSLSSPRGSLKLDAETQFYVSPAIQYKLEAGSKIPGMAIIPDLEKEWRAFTSKPTEGAITGWMNTYLCY